MKSSLRVYECKFCKGRSFAENPRECCGQKVVEICPLPRIGSKEWGWRLVFDSIEGKWWTSDKLKYQIGYYRNRPFVIHPRRGNCAEPTTTSEAKRIAELLARRDWRREMRGKSEEKKAPKAVRSEA